MATIILSGVLVRLLVVTVANFYGAKFSLNKPSHSPSGNCIPVDPYNNEVPWSLLEPIFEFIPDDGNNGKAEYIAADKLHTDHAHDVASEGTLLELARDPFRGCDEELYNSHTVVLLDLDETLISGARASAYFFALNHFCKLAPKEGTIDSPESQLGRACAR